MLILQWLSLIFLLSGTATPALFLFVFSGGSLTFGLFHACLVTGTSRWCQTYEGQDGINLFGSSHLDEQWSAFQALTVTLNVLAFAVAVSYTMRMVVVQRQRSLSKRAEIGLFLFSSLTLLLAFVSVILFLSSYSRTSPSPVSSLSQTKALGSSFTLILAAYIMQMIALFLQSYTFIQYAKAMRVSGAAGGTPIRAGELEPVPMAVVANPAGQYQPSAYTPAAAAAYQQPAFYGQGLPAATALHAARPERRHAILLLPTSVLRARPAHAAALSACTGLPCRTHTAIPCCARSALRRAAGTVGHTTVSGWCVMERVGRRVGCGMAVPAIMQCWTVEGSHSCWQSLVDFVAYQSLSYWTAVCDVLLHIYEQPNIRNRLSTSCLQAVQSLYGIEALTQ